MRALVALIVVAAIAFVGLGTYFTYQQQRRAEQYRQMTASARRAQAADRADGRHNETMPDARFDPSNPAHGLLSAEPLAFEAKLTMLVHRYAKLGDAARQTMRASSSQGDLQTLLHFAERCAVFGLRSGSIERCAQGWTAIAMLRVRGADRETGLPPQEVRVAIGLLDHATRKITQDVGPRIESTRALASPAVATILGDFGKRAPSERRLAAVRYAELVVDGEIGFVRTGTAKYEPRIDLARIGLAIAASLDATQFPATDITIAESLPSRWFRTSEKSTLEQHLDRVRGTVTVRATPLGRAMPADHEFVVSLSEAFAAEDCAWFTNALRRGFDGGVSTAVAVDEVFCIVVSRSLVMHGKPPHSATDVEKIAARIGTLLNANRKTPK